MKFTFAAFLLLLPLHTVAQTPDIPVITKVAASSAPKAPRALCAGQMATAGRPAPKKPISQSVASGEAALPEGLPLGGGYTWVNSPTKVYDQLPFGGVKSSGLGKEHGTEALDPYTDLKSVVMGHLSPIERLILVLYYFEDMTMKEIGATLDLSESRVSQMHSSIVSRLQSQLCKRRPEFSN